ncbi:MAG: tail fiber domain-containing protein [Chitinophagaceae bacterium]|nr:tail fiber domain-containing protein [Chitinophagaceae bacterium]
MSIKVSISPTRTQYGFVAQDLEKVFLFG